MRLTIFFNLPFVLCRPRRRLIRSRRQRQKGRCPSIVCCQCTLRAKEFSPPKSKTRAESPVPRAGENRKAFVGAALTEDRTVKTWAQVSGHATVTGRWSVHCLVVRRERRPARCRPRHGDGVACQRRACLFVAY